MPRGLAPTAPPRIHRDFQLRRRIQPGSAQHLGNADNPDRTPELRFQGKPQKQDQPEPTICGFRLYWPQGRLNMP